MSIPAQQVVSPPLRVRLRFTPQWAGPIEGFAVNYARANEWRVRPEMDADDLYQDAWLTFNKLKQKYPLVIEPQHFMALFRTSLWRATTTLANRRTARGCVEITEPQDLSHVAANELLADAEVRMMLGDAPDLIKALVDQIGAGAAVPQRRMIIDGRRETTRDLVTRIIGAPYNWDVIAYVRGWINGEPYHVQAHQVD